tara:strand:- start:4387 stop:4998 length:612 start_codon:yes stop_codon:yes gene_type:complete
MKSLILIGAGGHAKSLIDIIEGNNDWEVYGLVGKESEIGGEIFGYPIIGSDKDLPKIQEKCKNAIISIGKIGKSNKRLSIEELIIKMNFNFPSIQSKYSIVSSNSSIGNGTTIGHGAIINAGSSIGNHCIINTNALIEHDCIIHNHVHISTGVIINGNCEIGLGSFIGSGSIIRDGVKIPSNTVISAGKTIMGWPQWNSTQKK